MATNFNRPIMPYKSIPKRLKQMIETGVDRETFEHEIKRPRYSATVQRGARVHYERTKEKANS